MRVLKDPGETNLAYIFAKTILYKGGRTSWIKFTVLIVNLSKMKSDTDYNKKIDMYYHGQFVICIITDN